MTFTYLLHEGVPSDSDAVRLLIGDTDEANFTLHDEEIGFFLAEEHNKYMAGAAAAEAAARKLEAGYYEDQKVGETRLRFRRINELILLANQLRRRGANHMLPDSGGIYQSDADTMDANTDIIKGKFYKGMHDLQKTIDSNDPLV